MEQGRIVLQRRSVLVLVLVTASVLRCEGWGKEWCVADKQAPEAMLQAAIDWACGAGGADCRAINGNGACVNPNTLASHASYAFNSYWQRSKHRGGSCHFDSAAYVTETNPSHGGCVFEYIP